MAGLFDDLIPQAAAPSAPQAQGNAFADLIPPAAPPVPLPPVRPPQQTALDKLVGINGPRYQTWPERLARGLVSGATDAATLPHDVMQEAQQQPTQISDSDVSRLSVPSTINFTAVANPVPPTMRAGEGAALIGSKMVKDAPPIPSAQTLQDTAAAGYNAARNSGLNISGDAVARMANGVKSGLEQDGIIAELAPKTHAILDKLTNPPAGAYANIGNFEAIRRSLQFAARDFSNPTEQLAASRAIQRLDSGLEGLSAKDVVAGAAPTQTGMVALPPPVPTARPSAEDVASILRTARGNYAAAQRSNSLTGVLDRANTGILERAEARAQAANSGRNLDNTIRQKIASLLEKPKEVSGYSDAELAALNGVVEGSGPRNAARYVGNLLGGGGGLGQFVTSGIGAGVGSSAGPIGAAIGATAPPAVGIGSKMIANALAKRSLSKADELIRSNSPLYQDMVANAPLVPANLARRAAVAKALLMGAMNGQQQ